MSINFKDMNLSEITLNALEKMNISLPSQIQQKAIPLMLEDKDLIGQSQTGSGKTLAFAIPIVEKINGDNKKNQAIILCPTRELALQIEEVFVNLLEKKSGVGAVCLYGGEPINRQITKLKGDSQIIIGTPGRVLDHIRRKTIHLNSIQILILDEADEMLNMGFKEDIEEILSLTPEYRQTALFSATMPNAIKEIAKNYQNNPESIFVSSNNLSVFSIKQEYLEIDKSMKFNALMAILLNDNPAVCMIFCNTKRMVDELTEKLLANRIKAAGLHGDLSQNDRTKIMNSFKDQRINVLVCSDVAARGIDVNNVELVVNYDLPNEHEYYLHRIGRTGRAGKTGEAITFISGRSQMREFLDITKKINAKIDVRKLPTINELKNNQVQKYVEDLFNKSTNISEDYSDVIDRLHNYGMSDESIINVLISKTFKLAKIEEVKNVEKRKRSEIDTDKFIEDGTMTRIRIGLGQVNKVKVSNVVCALIEDAGLKSEEIGKINIFRTYTLVDVPTNGSKKVIERLNRCKISKQMVSARVYRIEK